MVIELYHLIEKLAQYEKQVKLNTSNVQEIQNQMNGYIM